MNAEIVQSTGNLHHHVGDTCLGQAQDIFDNPTAFDSSDHVLHLNSDTGDHLIEEFVGYAEFLAARLFFGWRVSTPAGS
jgi:hypothetical protein